MQSNRLTLWRFALSALLWVLALPVLAQPVYGVVNFPGHDLYAEPKLFSTAVGSVPSGAKVEFVQRDGTWWKVRWSGKEGWMSRAFIEKLDTPAALAPVLADSSAPPAAVVFAAPTSQAVPATPLATPARERGRAVVFGISHYQPGKGIPTLDGVPHDMNSAVAMAQLMGISEDRISIFRDDQLTKASMTAILTQLAKEINEGDPVLVYYSGHGSRQSDPDKPGRCIEGLITYDAQALTSAEMSQLLQPLAKITDGLFVFFDSCHSGGLSSTREVSGQQRFTPKFVAIGDVSNCSEIVNMLQTPATGTRATGNRYVYAAAARADEISLDDAQNGGLATSNFLRCMVPANGEVKTVEAIRACAQQGIEQSLASVTMFKPHHMTITGDLSTRPVRADLSPALKQQLLASASQGTLANRPASPKAAAISSALASQGWPPVVNPMQAFAAIAARTDSTSGLAVETPETLKIDVEALRIKVIAPADGYVYVFQTSEEGKNALMLFPNVVDRDHRVRAGQTLDLPRPSWKLVASGPVGEDQVLVVFSASERDLGQLVGQAAGPFLDLAVSPTGMQALALAVSRSAYASDAECKPSSGSPPAYCSAKFSASLKTIREVR